ncbi:MAG: 50S ribosomal protein L9 [Eggerthellaceae bacterium]
MAILATKGNLKQLEQRRGNIAKREEKRIEDANALKASLEGKKILVELRLAEGILFGSVTAQMIVDAVKKELDIDIDRKRLELKKAIKVAGEHVVTLSIYRDIKVDLNLFVGEEKVEEPVEETEEVVEEAVEATEEAAE